MDELLTTKELSQLLRLNEKKIYELIRESTLPHVRIAGKWLFPKNHILRWIDENVQHEKDIMIAGSDDILFSRLLSLYSRDNKPESVAYYASIGSAAGVLALSSGKCQICCSHILDFETGEYNLPFLARTLGNQKYLVVNLCRRTQGLIVKKGNPLGIKGMDDIIGGKVRFVNRNKGSGTRFLFDYLLSEKGLDDSSGIIQTGIVDSHMEVASKVFFGEADTGLAIEYVANPMGLDFIPIRDERFDLVVLKELWPTRAIKRFIEYLDHDLVKKVSRNLPGYNLRDTGTILFSS